MTSLEQLRLYNELMRITHDVTIDIGNNDAVVRGFEYNGTYDDFVHVRNRSGRYTRYLLSYVTKSTAKAFREILRDVNR